jgi:hypothetical protein
MTKLERRVHRLIEKAIVEHGYVLRPGWFRNDEDREVCAVGAIDLALGNGGAPGYVRRVSDALGISHADTAHISHGFEWGLGHDRHGALFRLGRDIRERYVVNG